jgi:hypothetical protein
VALKYNIIIYTAMTNPYARIVETTSGRIWDDANGVLDATPTFADTVIDLTLDAVYIGGTPMKIPALLQSSEYDLLFYDNAVPAITDAVVVGNRYNWDGYKLYLVTDE